jgi:hypothetical protein
LPAETDISAKKYDESKVPTAKNYARVKSIRQNKEDQIKVVDKDKQARTTAIANVKSY